MNYPDTFRDQDEEDLQEFSRMSLLDGLGMIVVVFVVVCFLAPYIRFKELHVIWRGLILSAVAGVATALIIFLVVWLTLEGIL